MAIEPDDLHAQPYFDDPFPVWERLRHDQPLFHDTVDDRWLLTRYDDVATVFRDHETYSTRPYERIFTDVIGPTMVQMDGDDHDVRRSIVARSSSGAGSRRTPCRSSTGWSGTCSTRSRAGTESTSSPG